MVDIVIVFMECGAAPQKLFIIGRDAASVRTEIAIIMFIRMRPRIFVRVWTFARPAKQHRKSRAPSTDFQISVLFCTSVNRTTDAREVEGIAVATPIFSNTSGTTIATTVARNHDEATCSLRSCSIRLIICSFQQVRFLGQSVH